MLVCPNCGRLVSETAQICPHCGCDEETGWREDADYYSVELPEDEFSEEIPAAVDPRGPSWRDLPGHLILFLSVLFFTWAGFETYGWGVLIPLLVLGGCGLFYVVGTSESTAS